MNAALKGHTTFVVVQNVLTQICCQKNGVKSTHLPLLFDKSKVVKSVEAWNPFAYKAEKPEKTEFYMT
jgi:hypothetical protein